MANYNPSTRNRIADIKDGLLVETIDELNTAANIVL